MGGGTRGGGLTGKVAPSPKLSLLRRVDESERPGRRRALRQAVEVLVPRRAALGIDQRVVLRAQSLGRGLDPQKDNLPHDDQYSGHHQHLSAR